MNEDTKKAILQWIHDNHRHHAYEDVPRDGEDGVFDEKWVDCPEASYPYVNSLELEKFIKSL